MEDTQDILSRYGVENCDLPTMFLLHGQGSPQEQMGANERVGGEAGTKAPTHEPVPYMASMASALPPVLRRVLAPEDLRRLAAVEEETERAKRLFLVQC
jgi:hypothetical protein